ncbi:hypothetical protein [Amycolatopsis sp. 195334CR]|uniref:hypothetical protein n=1 Tax=Amycolatopsis sp. 195334CR TaxID=2814588 RepID=UPI001A8F0661|nr:hypothetical protein [Amycolatopsis sp. 195334CR]MBN6037490.1 hypothetical protein [Amycolatopsis sp. 195334CR]
MSRDWDLGIRGGNTGAGDANYKPSSDLSWNEYIEGLKRTNRVLRDELLAAESSSTWRGPRSTTSTERAAWARRQNARVAEENRQAARADWESRGPR